MKDRSVAHYNITRKIGAGGMGVVYQATDTKLNREVAVKVLADEQVDSTRRARLSREAAVLAQLNHPSIAAIYGLEEVDGAPALVLELVEGETLSSRIKRPLSLDQTIEIALQICEAVEAAHEIGIIHRDLKPANIKLTPAEKVKVLDFGLAKAVQSMKDPEDQAHTPTVSVEATQAGKIVGTVAYMSPEQARGRLIDERTDIWAFGCVLFELICGSPPFKGDDTTELLAAVMRDDPDWSTLPQDLPSGLGFVLRRCLAKDPNQRFHHMADVRITLQEIGKLHVEGASDPGAKADSTLVPWAVAATFLVVSALLGWQLIRTAAEPPQDPETAIQLAVPLSEDNRLALDLPAVSMARDGSKLALATSAGVRIRVFATGEWSTIPNTENAQGPFLSPDGMWVAYMKGGKLWKSALAGGPPIELAAASRGGGSWGDDGAIVYSPDAARGLWMVEAVGGEPTQLTRVPAHGPEIGHGYPQVLPGAKHVIFTRIAVPIEESKISIYSRETKEISDLHNGGMFGRYVPGGHIVYLRGSTLLAVPFDLETRESGTPFPVLEDLEASLVEGMGHFDFSANGVLAFLRSEDRQLTWVNRQGEEQLVLDTPRLYSNPAISPDGSRLAFAILEEEQDTWVYDIDTQIPTRLTFGSGAEFGPVWTPDGNTIIYSVEKPTFDLFRRVADGSAPELSVIVNPYNKSPWSVTPDGTTLLFSQKDPVNAEDIWTAQLNGEPSPRLLLQTAFSETQPSISPDGKWLAYVSLEPGREEVFVQPYPGLESRVQVSIDGGKEPHWTSGGREVIYRQGDQFLAAAFDPRTGEVEAPVTLFVGPYESELEGQSYDVSKDGQRFVVSKIPPMRAVSRLRVILHWFEDLDGKQLFNSKEFQCDRTQHR